MVFLQTRGGVETWSDAIIDGRTANYVQNSNTNIFRQKKENKMFACVLRQLRDVPEGNPIRKIEMEKLNVWVLFGSNDLMATASLGSCTLRRCINKGRGKEKKIYEGSNRDTPSNTPTHLFLPTSNAKVLVLRRIALSMSAITNIVNIVDTNRAGEL